MSVIIIAPTLELSFLINSVRIMLRSARKAGLVSLTKSV